MTPERLNVIREMCKSKTREPIFETSMVVELIEHIDSGAAGRREKLATEILLALVGGQIVPTTGKTAADFARVSVSFADALLAELSK